MKKTDLEARCVQLDKERTLLQHGISILAARDRPLLVERWRGEHDKQERYSAALYRPTSPHGGIVIVTFTYPGQRDSVSVYYASEWAPESLAHGIHLGYSALATAAERIRDAMRRCQARAEARP